MSEDRQNNLGRPDIEHFRQRALEMDALWAKVVPASSVTTAAWVRMRCQYGCPAYAKGLTCPPHSPTFNETQKIIDSFETAILMETPSMRATSIAVELEREIFIAGYYKALSMGSGPCMICQECALDEGCRFPYKARPSMESCGVDVYKTLRNNGVELQVVKEFDSLHRHFAVVMVE